MGGREASKLSTSPAPGPERKTNLMAVASYDDFFDKRDGAQEGHECSDFTSRSWTMHWFKNTSAEVQVYLYIELHKASPLTSKDFFDDPKGPLLACIGKIKDVELNESGLYERNVLAHALKGFAEGEITIDDLANIDKDFENALPYVDTFAVPPALNGLSNTGAVDYISYGHLRVEIADPEVKTAHGGDINMLYVYRVTLITDKDTGLPYIFSFPSDEFVAPPPAFDFRSPKLQDCNMVAQSYKMYLVVGLLIQGEHNVTPSLYELVDDIKHTGDTCPMVVTHTNAEWLAMIETWRFRDLLRRASIKVMNAIDTAKGREAIQVLTPNEPARKWGKYLSDHIIDSDAKDKVSDHQAAARRDAITKFRSKLMTSTQKASPESSKICSKVAAAFSVWWHNMDMLKYSFPHKNLKTILIDNQRTQIVGMKSMMISWFKEKPWDETQRLRTYDFEKWPGLPLLMTEEEERAERQAAERRRLEAA
eukprot:jgi/Tetstr1/439623/TSEL_028045.t1